MEANSKFVVINGEAQNWEEAIRLCGEALVSAGYVDEAFVDGCVAREKEYPTGIPGEVPVAIPHFQGDGIQENSICLLRLKKPITFYRMDADDEYIDTQYVFNLAIKGSDNHLEYLQKLMGLVMDKTRLELCYNLPGDEASKLLETYLT